MKKILTLSFLGLLSLGGLSSCVYDGPYGYSYAPSYWSLWGGHHDGPHGSSHHGGGSSHHSGGSSHHSGGSSHHSGGGHSGGGHSGGGHMGGGGHHGGGGHR